MRLQFLGATDTVTGSRFLVQDGDRRVLVDCGLFQGLKALRERNWAPFPVDPARIDAVVLTHAHLDHSGYLPALVRDGFRGDIWCTPLTASLVAILLRDSAYLLTEEARHRNKHGTTRHDPALPLYTPDDAEQAIGRLRPHPFGSTWSVTEGMTASFSRAGHILGAACVRVEGADGHSVAFTGDVGRPADPVMMAPEPLPAADHVVTESTYGDRRHADTNVFDDLADVVRRTVDRGGSVLIPSFAVGRAQLLLHLLAVLRQRGDIPAVPTYLNSPMAISVTELMLGAAGEHRLDAVACRALSDHVTFVRSADESRALNQQAGPKIIITASGMMTGGRVLHHLVSMAPDPDNTILLPGYQAVGTRGRSIANGAASVKVFGQYVQINAEVAEIGALSAHADADELVTWLGQTPPPACAHVVHGEPGAADDFRRQLHDRLGWKARVAYFDDRVDV
ncbi:MAG: metallo-beta-lactamase family protein [Glaciecola sp.]|jgi:metallo-beta-lactamase family protein